MEKYREVNVNEYVDELKRCNEFDVIEAEKVARILARVGIEGEKVITYNTDEKGNTIIEKVAVVKPGDLVVIKAGSDAMPIIDQNGKKNEYIVDSETFAKRYEPTEIPGFFKPKGVVQQFVQIHENITIEQWESKMNVAAGGYINITNPNDIYVISERDFNDTYKKIPQKNKIKNIF